MDVAVQLYAGILLGVIGTDVPLSDFMDTIPEYKVYEITIWYEPKKYSCINFFLELSISV